MNTSYCRFMFRYFLDCWRGEKKRCKRTPKHFYHFVSFWANFIQINLYYTKWIYKMEIQNGCCIVCILVFVKHTLGETTGSVITTTHNHITFCIYCISAMIFFCTVLTILTISSLPLYYGFLRVFSSNSFTMHLHSFSHFFLIHLLWLNSKDWRFLH